MPVFFTQTMPGLRRTNWLRARGTRVIPLAALRLNHKTSLADR
jgi:hypothetical protein